MSPEQIKNAANVTTQSDIYSLGTILRECFTYHSPFDEVRQKVDKIFEGFGTEDKKVAQKDFFKEQIPVDIQAIIKKARQPSLDERYKNVQEFAKDIERYRNNL